MVSEKVERLKAQLLNEVSWFCKRDGRAWKEPVVETLHKLRDTTGLNAVFFGGTLRSLICARHFHNRPGRPRDVDIVLTGGDFERVGSCLPAEFQRKTRFGGLKLYARGWQFDLWPLDRTWAFVHDRAIPRLSDLPDTTFFNMEAIAVDVWPGIRNSRRIFSGDDQFFKGIITRTLEINRAENPYPVLCVVRAFTMATRLQFSVGPKLAGYLIQNGLDMSSTDLESVQVDHYGQCRFRGASLRKVIAKLANAREAGHSRVTINPDGTSILVRLR